jgi:hypothetical protein
LGLHLQIINPIMMAMAARCDDHEEPAPAPPIAMTADLCGAAAIPRVWQLPSIRLHWSVDKNRHHNGDFSC